MGTDGTCIGIVSPTGNKTILVSNSRDLPKHTSLTKYNH